MDAARKELSTQFEAVRDETASFENPVSRYRNREDLKRRADPMAQELAAMRETQTRLGRQIQAAADLVSGPPSTLGMLMQPYDDLFNPPPGMRLDWVPVTMPVNTPNPPGGTADSVRLVPRLVPDSGPSSRATGTNPRESK